MKWPKPTTDFKTVKEASDYFAKRYPFNPDKFPMMAGLTTRTQIKRFKAKHYLMQMVALLPYVSMAAIGKPEFDDEYGIKTRREMARFTIYLLLFIRERNKMLGEIAEMMCMSERERYLELIRRKRVPNLLSGVTIRLGELASFYALTDQRRHTEHDPLWVAPILFAEVFLVFRKFYGKTLPEKEEMHKLLNFLSTVPLKPVVY